MNLRARFLIAISTFLDPAHNTFLQSDVEEMRAKYGTKLDDQLYAGELSAAFDMYDLMTKRRYERYKYALSCWIKSLI